ncbi:MAG: site-specific integrase [Prevotellaceae bacterium]|jgi:integrase|nr:site-specific integrase [Prevotellaceae bacterium]
MPTHQHNHRISYIPARLTEGKEWFVSYYVIYPPTGKLRRKKVKMNRIHSITQRRIVARKLIIDINAKLYNGWNPFLEDEAPKSYHQLLDVLATYMAIQEKELEKNSLRSYRSYVKFIVEYIIHSLKTPKMYVAQFDKGTAADLMLAIKQNPALSNRTYNNYLLFYKVLFNWLKQYNYITANPFEGITKIAKRKTPKIRQLISSELRKALCDYLCKQNPNYLSMCMMCYYCFLRPNEISYLKVSDVDLMKQTILVRKEIAKNDKDSIRIIPDAMMPYMKHLQLTGDKDRYLFSFDRKYLFVPGVKHADSREIARYWSTLRDAVKIPVNVQFYSLKDTGITNMLADGVAANFVQGQADHSSLAITSMYAGTTTPASQEQIRKKAGAFV